jgi:hypothetical protein
MTQKSVRTLVPWLLVSAFFLVSCTLTPKTAVYLDADFPAAPALTTLALLPVVYDPDYDQPMEINLSRMIRSAARRELTRKGYHVILTGPHYLRGKADLLSADPAQLAEMGNKEADGVVLIHVNFHVGIDRGEYLAGGMFSTIDIYADARLVSRKDPRELWRDQGRGSDFAGTGGIFPGGGFRLQKALANLTGNLFETLPPRAGQP